MNILNFNKLSIYYLLSMVSLTTNNNALNCVWIYCCASDEAHISNSKTSLNIKGSSLYKEIRK